MMVGTWSDSDISLSDNDDKKNEGKEVDEEAKTSQVCLMATKEVKKGSKYQWGSHRCSYSW